MTTRMPRVTLWRAPVPVRLPLSLIVRPRSVREACSAGIRPNRMPVPSDTPTVNSSTRQSRPTTPPFSPTRGRSAVFTASSAFMPTTPSTSPQAPPIADSSTLSVSSCTMMRPRPAPMAERMAISRRRPVARTSSRLATLARRSAGRDRPRPPARRAWCGRRRPCARSGCGRRRTGPCPAPAGTSACTLGCDLQAGGGLSIDTPAFSLPATWK